MDGRRVWIIAFLAGLASGGCRSHAPYSPRIVEVFGGSLSILADPDAVDAFRIERPQEPSSGEYRTWSILRGPVALDRRTAREASDLLLREESYLPKDLYKSCLPRPGVRLVFRKGKEEASVYLCYTCRVLYSEGIGGEGRFAFFEPAAKEFVQLAKALFPDDPVIQALRGEGLKD